nr:MAG TPA: hypothetical protein [Caudoviricetes sp.]
MTALSLRSGRSNSRICTTNILKISRSNLSTRLEPAAFGFLVKASFSA